MDKLKVLVVDDSVVYRKVISAAVEMTGKGEVDCTASSGITALERLNQRSVDVVLLDVFMEGLDGIQTLKQIKDRSPELPVIIISGGGEDIAKLTVKALELGAMDFILKPSGGNTDFNMQAISRQLSILFSQILVSKYTQGSKNLQINNQTKTQPVIQEKLSPSLHKKVQKSLMPLDGVDVVVIASSTGGPSALEEVCSNLDKSFNKPVLVVQHMPPEFTRIFAKSLGKRCSLPVKEAEDGEQIMKGVIYIAPGGFHLTIDNGEERGSKIARLNSGPMVNGVRPSADVLFGSIASVYRGQKVLAVILTGMGNDGTEGVARLKESCQCYCITQSEGTCVIYGMPRSVNEAGLSDESIDLERIGKRILEISTGKKQSI